MMVNYAVMLECKVTVLDVVRMMVHAELNEDKAG